MKLRYHRFNNLIIINNYTDIFIWTFKVVCYRFGKYVQGIDSQFSDNISVLKLKNIHVEIGQIIKKVIINSRKSETWFLIYV